MSAANQRHRWLIRSWPIVGPEECRQRQPFWYICGVGPTIIVYWVCFASILSYAICKCFWLLYFNLCVLCIFPLYVLCIFFLSTFVVNKRCIYFQLRTDYSPHKLLFLDWIVSSNSVFSDNVMWCVNVYYILSGCFNPAFGCQSLTNCLFVCLVQPCTVKLLASPLTRTFLP